MTTSTHLPRNLNIPENFLPDTSTVLTPTTPSYNQSFNYQQFQHLPQEYVKQEYMDIKPFPNPSFATTPISAYTTSSSSEVFKFEPEDIERLTTTNTTPSPLAFGIDYFNYDEINCQSKNQSPCSSPHLDPWMSLDLRDTSSSPKIDNNCNNNCDLSTYKLPSMISTFGPHLGSGCSIRPSKQSETTSINNNFYNNNMSSSSVVGYEENKYNCVDYMEVKPNREHKDIWTIDEVNSVDDDNNGEDDNDNDDDVFMELEDCTSAIAGEMEHLEESLQCRWTDCNEFFKSQGELVAHIEKRHVEVKKGEEFSCFWFECPRRYKPFNARYKLLIHMRTHSGEKPNKCPVSCFLLYVGRMRVKVGLEGIFFMISIYFVL